MVLQISRPTGNNKLDLHFKLNPNKAGQIIRCVEIYIEAIFTLLLLDYILRKFLNCFGDVM